MFKIKINLFSFECEEQELEIEKDKAMKFIFFKVKFFDCPTSQFYSAVTKTTALLRMKLRVFFFVASMRLDAS